MKKTILIALSMLLLIAGCGKNNQTSDLDDTDTKEQLVIYGLESGYGTEGWEKVVDQFSEEFDVDVELVLEKNIDEVLRPKIQAEEIPDLIYLAVGSTGGLTDTMIAEKNIMAIDDVLKMEVPGEDMTVEEKVLPGFFEGLRTSPYGDGQVYLAPLFFSPLGLFYNEGLFDEKGWEVPETWDELFALGEAAAKEDIALFTYPTTGYFDGFFSALLNVTAGPDLYARMMNYDLEAWKDPKVKEAFEIVGRLAEMTHEDTVSQANKEGFQKNQQLILDNKALFIPNGTWLVEEMEDAPRDDHFEWGFMPVPAVDNSGDAYSSTFSEEIYIPEGAKNVDMAKKFISYLYTDEAAKLFYENGGAVQPIVDNHKIIADDDPNKLFYEIYEADVKANSIGFAAKEPVEGVDLTSETGILYGTVNSVVTGQKTVDEWYEDVIEAVEKYNE